jgi:hypothetical protein
MVLVNRTGKSMLNWGPACIALTFLLLIGCAATEPNRSILDPDYTPPKEGKTTESFSTAREILTEISLKNDLLAVELGKLPELQDGISFQETQALKRLHRKYVADTDSFDRAFKKMYKTGLPDVRKYCSPLQALFWLAEDNELHSNSNLFVNYSLEHLLAKAWKFDPLSYRLISETQTKEVINGIQMEDIKKKYLDDLFGGATYAEIQRSLVADYKRSRRTGWNTFSRKASKIIRQNLISPKAAPRWQDFSVVIDRLNAPELVDYYEKARFKYVYWWELPTPAVSPHYVFKYNKGECVSITRFTVLCLTRAGYKAREYRGRSISGRFDFHAVCVYEMNGKKYVMDNGKTVPSGIIPWDLYRYK